jgi:diaminopimelate epimerase
MELEFTKMHGAGNDFVFIDCLKQNVRNLGALAKRLCDRRFGVGADQLLTIQPSKVADFKMEIYNADGSQVEMCGNGIRCFAKYVYDHGLTTKRALEVETLAGIIRPRVVGELVEVDMGEPILEGRKIPVDADGEIKNRRLTVAGNTYEVTCVSMGNPHCLRAPPLFSQAGKYRVHQNFKSERDKNARLGARRRRNLGLRHGRERGSSGRRGDREDRALDYCSSKRRRSPDRMARQQSCLHDRGCRRGVSRYG